MNGRDICYHHGGATPRGLASPKFKDGRYSKSLPAQLAVHYQEARRDPELLDMADDIALVDTRLAALIQRVEAGESGRLWSDVRAGYKDLRAGIIGKDPRKMKVALDNLDLLISRGQADYAAWSEISALLDQRRRFIEAQQKLLTAKQQIVTTEEAITLASALLASVKQVVTDNRDLNRIQTEFERLMLYSGKQVRGEQA